MTEQRRPRTRVHDFSISLDGFGTGEGLTQDQPFGHAGQRLHEWMFSTATGRAMIGRGGGTRGVDEALVARSRHGIGAEIMGRRKFHTGTGPLPDDWRGWWGEEPPFGTPVLVLTHHPRPPIEMAGGTTFHFLDLPPAEALAWARDAAGGLDVHVGGGVSTLRAFLDADLVDDLHLVVVPVVLGRGQRLWDGLEGLERRFDVEQVATPSGVVHVTMTRREKRAGRRTA